MAEDEENTTADEAAAAHDHDHGDADHDHAEHGHAEEIHMPPNSWWPMVTAIGVAVSLVGIIFLDLPFIIAIGVIILIGGIVMWVVDARKEFQELH